MTRKRLGAIDRSTAEASRDQAEQVAAGRRRSLKAPPIAQVANDAASAFEGEVQSLRQENVALKDKATAFDAAEAEGRVILSIPLDQIDANALKRDRRVLDKDSEDWAALKDSLRARGQQTPIEVVAGPDGYRLISGFRRLAALRDLHEETQDAQFAEVKAIASRARDTLGDMLAMVEENEIRQEISFYERGRICCLAVEQGLCATLDEAIEALFPNAHRNRRYKIRSFGLLFLELGPYLDYPEQIGERLGLKLAKALKDGRGAALVAHLQDRDAKFADAEEEGALLDAFCAKRGVFADNAPVRDVPKKIVVERAGGLKLSGTRTRSGLFIEIQGMSDTSDDAFDTLLRKMAALVH